MYVSVLTQIGVKAVDQTFFYHVPKLLENNIKIGVRVRIPFGNMILDGFALGISLCQEVQKASVYSTQLQELSGADIFKKREMLEEAGENIWK